MIVVHKNGLYYKKPNKELSVKKRRKYLSMIAEIHQKIKKEGIENIPDAWFEDDEEGGYLVEKAIPFPNVYSLYDELTNKEKKEINEKRFKMLNDIKKKTGIIIYDSNLKNALYDKENKEVYLIDFEQANVLKKAGFTK